MDPKQAPTKDEVVATLLPFEDSSGRYVFLVTESF